MAFLAQNEAKVSNSNKYPDQNYTVLPQYAAFLALMTGIRCVYESLIPGDLTMRAFPICHVHQAYIDMA